MMKEIQTKKRIDWIVAFTPMLVLCALAGVFFLMPSASNAVLERIRCFIGEKLGVFYIVFGVLFFTLSMFLCVSGYGGIRLGNPDEKPRYSFIAWGCMMFTCGLAADIIFYSFSEWMMYVLEPHVKELGDVYAWASVYPLFHWGLIPWSFYLVLAVSFGFLLHVKHVKKQRISESCRSILGKKVDGLLGTMIDLFCVFALLAGTATTFSVATPLMATIICKLFAIQISRNMLTIIIILLTCIVYTCTLLFEFKGIGYLAKICIGFFVCLLGYVFAFGGQGSFIVKNGLQSFARMVLYFIPLATYTDIGKTTHFAQDWTIYYWSYWIVWCVAAPFFIGNISRGRTVRQTIIGGYLFGAGATLVSFVVFGNYSMGLQMNGVMDFVGRYRSGIDIYEMILQVLCTLPHANFVMLLVLILMVAFYATSFDSIAYTAACYSYRTLAWDEKPHRLMQMLWCVLLVVLPMGLVFADSSMSNIQTVSILAAFPMAIIMLIVVAGFLKDAKRDVYMDQSAAASSGGKADVIFGKR